MTYKISWWICIMWKIGSNNYLLVGLFYEKLCSLQTSILSIHKECKKKTCSVAMDKLYKSILVLKCHPTLQCCLQLPSLLTLNPSPNLNKKIYWKCQSEHVSNVLQVVNNSDICGTILIHKNNYKQLEIF